MKTLNRKPTLEVLEDRLTLSGSPWPLGPMQVAGSPESRPMESLSLNLRAETRIAEVTDGTSNTLMVGERPPSQDLLLGRRDLNDGYWTAELKDVLVTSVHAAGGTNSAWLDGVVAGDFNRDGGLDVREPANACFGDGSVRGAASLVASTEYFQTCKAPTEPVLNTEANRFQEQPLSALPIGDCGFGMLLP